MSIVAGTTDAAHPVTTMRVYVDSKQAYNIAANSISTSLPMAVGAHTITVNAWDSAGTVFTSTVHTTVTSAPPPPPPPPGSCTATAAGITMCSPLNGATVSSPFQVLAAVKANAGTVITANAIYLDFKLAFSHSGADATGINTTLTAADGSHSLITQAWDATGHVYQNSEMITVGSGTPGVSVSVAPTSATLAPGATQQFTATVQNATDTSVNWSVDGVAGGNATVGTIGATGLYTAPAAIGSHTVTATSVASPAAAANASVTVSQPSTTCTASVAGVTVCTPTNGATVSSSFPVVAAVKGNAGTTITANAIYLDFKLAASHSGTGSTSISTTLSAAAGSHSLITQAWDNTGHVYKTTQTITVGSGSPPPPPTGSANVLTWHNDNNRSGLNSNEQALTPATVNPSSFGKLFSYSLDGFPYAEPLYISGLSIGGTKHNVVFAATEKASVYAFDADNFGTGAPLWKASLLASGETPMSASNTSPFRGITGTPVIDPASGTMFVVAFVTSAGASHIKLHALDITTGADRPGSPVELHASVPSSASNAVNGALNLTPGCTQRAALAFGGGTVFIGFSACEQGWLLSYDAATLQQIGIFNASPNENGFGTFGGAGGIWMGGGGPAIDDAGNVYIVTGNGPFGVFPPGTGGVMSYGNSVLKMDRTLHVLDTFTPHDQAFLWCSDTDYGSGGLMLAPGSDQIITGGKNGRMIVLNRTALGGNTSTDSGALASAFFDPSKTFTASCTDASGNVLSDTKGAFAIYATAAWFNGSFYVGASNLPLRRFTVSGSSITPVVASTATFGGYGAMPVISSNGSTGGIVWALDTSNALQQAGSAGPQPAILRAFDATSLAELYNSTQNAADVAGFGLKFTSPIVANGKVFFGTAHTSNAADVNATGQLDVYGHK